MTARRERLRIAALLADRATQGLGPAAARELAALLAAELRPVDEDAFDLAAAALDVALQAHGEPMPDHVRTRLQAAGRRWVARGSGR